MSNKNEETEIPETLESENDELPKSDNRWLKNSFVYLIVLVMALGLFFQYFINPPQTTPTQGSGFDYKSTIISVISIIFSYILLRSSFFKSRSAKKVQEKYPNLSVIAIMLRKKQNATLFSTITLGLTLLTMILFRNIAMIPFSTMIFIIGFVLLMLPAIKAQLLEFRIRKGYYGRNEYEAREIIEFVLNHSKDIDFTDGGRPKPLFTEEDLEQIKIRLHEGLVGGSLS